MPKEIEIELLGFDRRSVDRNAPIPAGLCIHGFAASASKGVGVDSANAAVSFVLEVAAGVKALSLRRLLRVLSAFAVNPSHLLFRPFSNKKSTFHPPFLPNQALSH
ncbi:MAG: hypothetical protein ABSH19_02395 [Opitutales bacterium]|jgi:hypothetical protein